MGVTRIQHNLSAMNSMSNYQGNSNRLTGNLEKLSSGYRINSAADDAAGLAISEKMRSQIAGLQKAQDNANDGVSLVQTAEGALTEVNSMLTRLKSLATQSANGTYEDGVDRLNIQEETNALLSEIDRISESTNFNGIKLLDGSLSGKSEVANLAVTETNATTGKFTIGKSDALKGIGNGLTGNKITFSDATADESAKFKLTNDDIGKSINYTVTWKDADGNEKTTTASITFMGQDGSTVADLTKTASAGNNYFVDAQGTKYNLSANAELTGAQIRKAIKAGLESDEEFSANFKITNGDGTTDENGVFLFETKATGASTAQITGGSADADFTAAKTNTNLKTLVAGTDTGTAALTQEAQDAYQRFDITKLALVGHGASEKEINAATFEVDGEKFLVATTDWDETDQKALDKDITVIKTAAAAGTSALDASTNAQAGKDIAAAIQQKTGRVTEYHDTAAAAADPGGDVNDPKKGTGINAGDIIFKETDNKLNLSGNELTLQIGDTPEKFQQVNVKIQDMSSKGLGLTGLDLSNQEGAAKAIDTIQNAVNAVSTQRGQLGALQNRLDHTLNSLDATEQNITAAESQIRDVDMAKEMTQYSKNNILVQAAQSMLAQANSLPQGVLSLLQ